MVAQIALQKLTLVLGGAASGKSAFAEGLTLGSGRPCLYIATAEAHDAEMAGKFARHKARRGAEWRTLEVPLDIAPALAAAPATSAVLLDCATLWLGNRMLAGQDLASAGADLCAALAACPAPVVIVSNEVGQGIVPDHAMGRAFRNAQGLVNQALAAQADLAVQVIAGLPLVLKGALPGPRS